MIKVYGAPAHHYAVYTELEEIEEKLKAEKHIKGNPISEFFVMLKAPRMGYRIALGMGLQAFQQLTGANYVCLPCLIPHHMTDSRYSSSIMGQRSSSLWVSAIPSLHR